MFTSFLLTGTLGDQLNEIFYGFDMSIFRIFGSIHSDFLTIIAKAFTAMGSEKYIALLAVMGLVMCFFKRTRKVGFSLVFAVMIGTLITNIIIKPAVLRIRPYNTLQNQLQYWAWYLDVGGLSESDYSFPSGHTTGAFEIATALFLCHFKAGKKGVAFIFPVCALLTAMSRIYLMIHYPSDVVAGIVIGIFSGIVGYLLASLLAKSIQKRKIDDIVDLGRLFKNGIKPWAAAIVIAVAWVLIFAFAFLSQLKEGGADTIRCAYDREYDCQNEAQVDDDKYPPINGEYYCKIHWKQLNEQFAETGSIEEPSQAETGFTSTSEPITNTDFFSFYNDPAVTAFRDGFDANPPVKLLYTKNGNKSITVTDPELIRRVFDALCGVQVGGEASEIRDYETDAGISYTFVMPDENTLTLGIVYPYTILYNEKYYDITNDNGAFDLIPDDYWEGIEPVSEETTPEEEALPEEEILPGEEETDEAA